jgi:nitrite reductase/ring-hydroxylating ferredoxin subunit
VNGGTDSPEPIDLERVICRFDDLENPGARAFTIGGGEWPLRGFVVRVGAQVYGYVNHCPHAGHPLDLLPGRFLTPDGALILCASHGALFEKSTGLCVAGPCAGQALVAVAVKLLNDFVLLADAVDVHALRDLPAL